MLKLIVYLVLGFYSTYMEVVQLVSKIRKLKIIPVSNQLPAKKKPFRNSNYWKVIKSTHHYIESTSCSKLKFCWRGLASINL